MRRIQGLAVLLVLLQAACARTPEPTALSTSSPPVTPVTRAALPTAIPTATGGVTETELAEVPTAATYSTETEPTKVPTAIAEASWPRFLRALDFGLPAGNSYNPRSLAVHSGLGRLYIRTRTSTPDVAETGLVTVFDLASGQVLTVVETGLDTYSEGVLAVDPVHNRIYAVNVDEATCTVLDAGTFEPLATLEGVEYLTLDAAGERLYIAGFSGLRLLDSLAYSVLLETPLSPDHETLAVAVDHDANRLYLARGMADTYALALYDATTLEEISLTPIPGRPEDLLAAPGWRRAFVTLNDGERNLLWILDVNGHLLEERVLGEWTQTSNLALDPGGGRLFLGRDVYGDYGITVVELQTGKEIADISLSRAPDALAWDEESGQLLVSHTYANQVSIVEIQGAQVRGVLSTALNLVDLAVDPQLGYLLVTDTVGQLHVLDSDTDEELAILPGEGHIAVDGPHGRFYTGSEGADRVRIFDAQNLSQIGEILTNAKPVADAYSGGLYVVRSGIYLTSLETMTITGVISDTLPQDPGFSPNPAAIDAVVDAGSGRLFAIVNNGVPGSNNGNYLYVYEPETYQKVLTDTERSPVYLDIDPNTGQAYVSRIHLAGRSTSLLADGRDYVARLEDVFGALRVDPVLGRVYLTVWGDLQGHMLILDAEDLNVLGSVFIPGGFTLRALDPERHLLYLAHEDGRVQIWSATGGKLHGDIEPVPAGLSMTGFHRLSLGHGAHPIFAISR